MALVGGNRHTQKKVEESGEKQANCWNEGLEIEVRQRENKISRRS